MAERKALFFLRHYNDIDHTVPIIYKWAMTTQLPAAIVLTGDRHYLEDYRIRFLRGLSGVRIYSLAEMLHDPNAPPEPETNHSLDPLIDSRASLYKILQAPQNCGNFNREHVSGCRPGSSHFRLDYGGFCPKYHQRRS